MRFKIPPVPGSNQLLDSAFKTVRTHTERFSKRIRKKERFAKEIEKNKIEEVAFILNEKLKNVSDSFPAFDALSPFERELVDATIDISQTKIQLSRLKKAAKIVWWLKSQIIRQIFASQNVSRIRKLSQSFYGRVCSVISKRDNDLGALEHKRKQLLELPNLNTTDFTVVIAGFPNVGKTTLLKSLTGSAPRIAPYPFTTQGLKIGFFESGFVRVQVIDTPGLLDRPFSKQNPIEKKAVAALRYLGDVMVFVIDPSFESGFSIEQQSRLFEDTQKLFKNKPCLAVISKTDIATKEQLKAVQNAFLHALKTTEIDELKNRFLKDAKDKMKKKPFY